MENKSHTQSGAAHEFVSCGCKKGETDLHQGCCVTPKAGTMTIGKKWATPLSGFIAGVLAASLVFVPWLIILGRVW